MEIIHVIVLVIAGGFAGFAGGLLGLGGAFVMTPAQFWVYMDMGLSADMAIKTAFGTSILVILPTAISGTWRHHREKAVPWRTAFIMGACTLAFAFVGAMLASQIPGNTLKITFGVIALLSCVRMAISVRESAFTVPVTNPWALAVWSIPLGLFAGLLGIGGGIIMIPVLVLALRYRMHTAVALSLAVIIFTSIGGITGYVISGVSAPEGLPYSIGYINLESWILLAAPAAMTAQFGAAAAHKIPRRFLTIIFVGLLFYIGLRMVGFFQWLGWPI